LGKKSSTCGECDNLSYSPCRVQLELTVLRIESRLKDIPTGEGLNIDEMSFMVDVDEMEDNTGMENSANRPQ
jgi:hypothetical protein